MSRSEVGPGPCILMARQEIGARTTLSETDSGVLRYGSLLGLPFCVMRCSVCVCVCVCVCVVSCTIVLRP